MPADNQRTPDDHGSRLSSGIRVEVWATATGRWVPGYEIVAASARGYVVRRLSDRVVLRRLFPDSDVRVDAIPMQPDGWTPGHAA
jgi:hypothetical protein